MMHFVRMLLSVWMLQLSFKLWPNADEWVMNRYEGLAKSMRSSLELERVTRELKRLDDGGI